MPRHIIAAIAAVAALAWPAAGPAQTLAGGPAPSVVTTLTGAERAELMRVRRDVWVNWFAGDTAALRRVLAPELIAISPDSRRWQNLEQTLAGAVAFRESGGRLDSVTFADDSLHRIGDVVIMFSHYRLVMSGGGQHSTQAGRATEVFVRRGGRWVHTSWHLDITGAP